MKLPNLLGAKRNRRIITTVFIVGLVVGSAGIAAALSMDSVSTNPQSLFNSQPTDSDLNVQSYTTNVTGPDSIDVSMTLNNQDTTAAHGSDVRVQLRNSTTGTLLIQSTQSTGSVTASGTTQLSYSFQKTDLATNYERTFIVVNQTS